ncbi:MAG: aldo/keto reductase [Bacteroidota bacterium]|jgi:diketogulonate reductase-like aldo/keto reductase
MRISDIQGTVELKNGVPMPYFGLGVFLVHDGEEVKQAVKYALSAGYRHIDTASLYGNEHGVGQAIRESGVPRKDIFVTSKVWNSDQGYDNTLRAFDVSIKLLGFEYLDLYLVHWPVKGKYIETWKALEHLYAEGRVRAIGVSNFLRHHLEDLLAHCKVVPMVNQMEFHPRLVQQKLIDFCNSHTIQYEAWSPLMQGKIFNIKELHPLAEKYKKDIAQIVLRWNLQKGVVPIPKSIRRERIISNAQIFDFEIMPKDMQAIDRLDKNERVGADPDHFNF